MTSGEERFKLTRQLADTLQGRIYSAEDRVTKEFVVVKETWKQLVKLGKSRDGHVVPEDFHGEKRVMKYLSNCSDCDPGFVKLIDEWEDEHCFMYAMEMCKGGELFEYIKQIHTKGAVAHFTGIQAKLAQETMKVDNEWIVAVKHMFSQIVRCLAWMHSKKVCHLDMSLENSMIFSRQSNSVKIIDFGLAKYYPNGRFVGNQRIGKIGYMSPEVYAKKRYDPRAADIWSLGVMLFMCLIGAPPYKVPLASNPAFNFIIHGRLREVLKHWRRLRLVTDHALDLMNKIFVVESKRIKMADILKHPFVGLADYDPFQTQTQVPVAVGQGQARDAVDGRTEAGAEAGAGAEAEAGAETGAETGAEARAQSENEHENRTEKYEWQSKSAQMFIQKLMPKDLPSTDLESIFKEVEQTHNKYIALKRQRSVQQSSGHNDANEDLNITIKELTMIQESVKERLVI